MALNNEEELRIQRIETALSKHAIAISNLAPKQQLSHILALLERSITALTEEVASLKSQLTALKK